MFDGMTLVSTVTSWAAEIFPCKSFEGPFQIPLNRGEAAQSRRGRSGLNPLVRSRDRVLGFLPSAPFLGKPNRTVAWLRHGGVVA